MTNLMPSESDLSWAEVDACELPTAERPLRVGEFDDLFASALVAVDRAGPTAARLTLAGDGALEARVRDLVSRETSCCSFFTFSVDAAPGTVVLSITVPGSYAGVLDGLVSSAERARP